MANDADQPGLPPEKLAGLLSAATGATEAALGELLDAYRPLLLAMAEAEVDHDLRRKVSPSDLVQETLIEARRDFGDAAFQNGRQVEAWLKAMLLNNLADLRKRYRKAAKRDIRRERSVHDSRVQQLIDRVAQHEYLQAAQDDDRQAVRDRVARALKRLPREKRAIILWIHMKGMSLTEAAERVGKSYDAVRLFWKRSLSRLKQELEQDDDKPA